MLHARMPSRAWGGRARVRDACPGWEVCDLDEWCAAHAWGVLAGAGTVGGRGEGACKLEHCSTFTGFEFDGHFLNTRAGYILKPNFRAKVQILARILDGRTDGRLDWTDHLTKNAREVEIACQVPW
jgi:hypothetical protein